jgi:amino acid permease
MPQDPHEVETKIMSNVNLKLAAVLLALLMAAVAFGTTDAVAMFTRFFCTASVAIFAIASTLGLATRMRA